jgi:hypothetical protein
MSQLKAGVNLRGTNQVKAFKDRFLRVVPTTAGRKFVSDYQVYASGTSTADKLYTFKGVKWQRFFLGLFTLLQDSLASKSLGFKLKLSKYDTQHGHLFYNPTNNVMGMLFHTNEFPKGRSTAGSPATETANDCVIDDSYCYRNVLWLYGANKLYLLNGKVNSSLFKKLIWTPIQGDWGWMGWDNFFYKVDQALLGTSWIHINYFADLHPYIFVAIAA